MLPRRRSIEIEPGTPLARAVTRGLDAVARADAAGVDAAYREAVHLAAGTGGLDLWSALVVDHIAKLLALGRATLALERCNEYLRSVGPDDAWLRLLRAEVHSSVGHHSGVDADAAVIRAMLASRPDSLTLDETARLYRVEGLSAADRDDFEEAVRPLRTARQMFVDLDDQDRVQDVDRDLLVLAVREGEASAASAVVTGEPPRTVSDHLLVALALKRESRYEEAIHVLLDVIGRDFDPVLRFPVVHQLVVLLRLTRQDEVAERYLPQLRQFAAASPDPRAAAATVDRLSATGSVGGHVSPRFDRRVQDARWLIVDGRLDEAGHLLDDLRPHARTDRELSTWHLAAGELGLAKNRLSGLRSFLADAVRHLGVAADRASAPSLVEVRVTALRVLGRAHVRLAESDRGADDRGADEGRAAECWAAAHRLEEQIAERQVTDDVRRRMLEAVPDEHDERIRAAAQALDGRGPEAAAAIVVAMEAARGATILRPILPDPAAHTRDLPQPSDFHGAWRWVSGMADSLPRSQAAWLMHATPDRVHHALLGRGLLYHASVSTSRKTLTDAVDALMACWSEPDVLEASIVGGEFDEFLAEVAAHVGIGAVIPHLPPHVRRIAVIAGGVLSDIPFAAMTIPGGAVPIGLRLALSDLPCLSARLPLYRRSRGLRGDDLLAVRPPDGLTQATGAHARTVLDGDRATCAGLRAELERDRHRDRHRLVWIDSHGKYNYSDPTKSWLKLAPAGPDGYLFAEELQGLDLHGCGTIMLGACESGMAKRIGRDERIGFARASFHAGAASVLAARWVAKDAVAAAVLDRFQRYLRYLPRDIALHRAQLDVCNRAPGTPRDVPAVDHPARWACWTLYGDSGLQTGAGPVRRLLRRSTEERRLRGAPR